MTRATLDQLADIEAIKQLKARYWRAVDTKNAALLRAVFTADAITDFRDDGPPGANDHLLLRDADLFTAQVIAVLAGVITAHHGHMPEITIDSATTASGIWPMQDYLWVEDDRSPLPFRSLRGWGHYHDRYIRTPEGWKICATRLRRLKLDIIPR